MSITHTLEAIDQLLAAGAKPLELEPLLVRSCQFAEELEKTLRKIDDSGDERVRMQIKNLLAEVELRKTRIEDVIAKLWDGSRSVKKRAAT
jgi:hypothetical protein